MQEYFGWYYMWGMALEVKVLDRELVASIPFVPKGFEIVLKPVSGDIFRMAGGPMDGSRMWFRRSPSGEVLSIQADEIELAKVPPEKVPLLPVIERFPAPPYELTPKKDSAFDTLLDSVLVKQDGDWIDYKLPYPKHEFIQYLTAQDLLIFHGSNKDDITVFEPTRKSIELRDNTGRGNVQGVYGTQDALWAMFFAIVDRSKLRGSIRNGVMYFHKRVSSHREKKQRLAVYNFSINQDQLAERPYRTGTLYLCSRSPFVRLRMGEAFSNEWVSEEPIAPMAKLSIDPQDFPFLDQIGGHDDHEVIQWQSLGKKIRTAAVSAQMTEAGLKITLPHSQELKADLDAFVRLHHVFVPTASLESQLQDSVLVLFFTELPPAYRQTLTESYRAILTGP